MRTPLAIAGVFLVLQLVMAARWGILADEAYYAFWAESLAWGYHDQPPLIAGLYALFGRAVRLPTVLCGLAGLTLWRSYGDKGIGILWWIALPPLCWLTFFATPDATLLAAWAIGLAAAIAGGPWWWVVGVAGALATLSKYSGVALFPLAWLAVRDRSPHVLGGLVLHLVLLVPHGLWLMQNDFVSVGFQFHEGLAHHAPPGVLGPVLVLLQQLGVLTPFLFGAILWSWCTRPDTRVQRIAWMTSAPLALFFLLASLRGPPEPHWLAPAWIGAGVLLSHSTGPLHRLTWVGMGVGMLASLALILHVERGILRLPLDPAFRLHQGQALADAVRPWTQPDPTEPPPPPVVTERYQEAALLRWHGIEAWVHPDCGRPNEFGRGARPSPPFYFVRPPTTHPPTCVPAGKRHALVGQLLDGRIVGRWELFEP